MHPKSKKKLVVTGSSDSDSEESLMKGGADDSASDYDDETESDLESENQEDEVDEDAVSDYNEVSDHDDDEQDEEEKPQKTKSKIKNECLYTFAKKEDDEGDDDFLDSEFSDDDHRIEVQDSMYVKDEDRITKNIMTKYEMVRVIGVRAKQISQGAKPMIIGYKGLKPKIIAKLELKNDRLPFFIIRTHPNGKKEKWSSSELKKDIEIDPEDLK